MNAVTHARGGPAHHATPARRSPASAFVETVLPGPASELSSPSLGTDEPACPVFTSADDGPSHVPPYEIDADDVDPELIDLLRQLEGEGQLSRAVRFTPQPMEAVKVPASGLRPYGEIDDERSVDTAPEPRAELVHSDQDLAWSIVPEGASSPEPPSAAATRFDPRPGIVAFAGYGLAPEKLSELPAYALHVFARRRILHAGLAIARTRRPQDVELYRAALTAADEGAVRKGLALLVLMVCAVVGVIVAALGVLA